MHRCVYIHVIIAHIDVGLAVDWVYLVSMAFVFLKECHHCCLHSTLLQSEWAHWCLIFPTEVSLQTTVLSQVLFKLKVLAVGTKSLLRSERVLKYS